MGRSARRRSRPGKSRRPRGRRVVLKEHRGKPEGEQPAFIVRRVGRREVKRLLPVLAKIQALADGCPVSKGEGLIDEVEAFVRKALVGWENQTDPEGEPIAFDPADLDLCLTWQEVFELAELVVEAHRRAG